MLNDNKYLEATAKLLAAYEKLSTYEKTVLELIAIIDEPIPKEKILNCLILYGIKGQDNKLNMDALKYALNKLNKQELILPINMCNALFKEEIVRQSIAGGRFDELVKVVQEILPPTTSGRCFRQIRIAVHKQNEQMFIEYSNKAFKENPAAFTERKIFKEICATPFQPEWFSKAPIFIQVATLDEIFTDAITNVDPIPNEIFNFVLKQTQGHIKDTTSFFHMLIATILILQCKLDNAIELTKNTDEVTAHKIRGWIYFLQNKNDEAINEYEKGLLLLKKHTKKTIVFFYDLGGIFFIMALLNKKDTQSLIKAEQIIDLIKKKRDNQYLYLYLCLEVICKVFENRTKEANIIILDLTNPNGAKSIYYLFYILALLSTARDISVKDTKRLLALHNKAKRNGYEWLSMEIASTLLLAGCTEPTLKEYVDNIQNHTGINSITSTMKIKEEKWEHSLNELINLVETNSKYITGYNTRIIWTLNNLLTYCNIIPKEQKLLTNGKWSKGRPISLKRLYGSIIKIMNNLTQQDMEVCSYIATSFSMGYYFETKKALLALVNHPLLFLDNDDLEHIELLKGSPELKVEHAGEGFIITLSVNVQNTDYIIVQETPTKYRIIDITDKHKQMATLLGPSGLLVPTEAKDKVINVISTLSSIVTVQSSVSGEVEGITKVDADHTPHVRLLPFGAGLKAEILVKPFSSDGPYCKPGVGSTNLIVKINGKPYQTERLLEVETKKCKVVENSCPVLAAVESYNWEWNIGEPESCLQLLLELKQIGGDILIEWPEGERLQVTHEASFEHLKLKIKRETDWFSVSGELALDKAIVLDMKVLLEALDNSASRFIQIGDKQFIALTREFRRRLEEFKAFSDKKSKGSINIHPLAGIALQDFFENIGEIEADDGWKQFISHINSYQKENILVPSTIQTNLRDYQVDGFQWLLKLAYWGVGACLADDMGLGKTLQVIAVMLIRAKLGPVLVIMPTSVSTSWINEIQRHAPTLNIIMFNSKMADELSENLKPFDVVICTYGLLYQNSKRFEEINWQMIVLDEAQAIKNYTTKRSQAAMNLKGDFKVITTGTPIENHLGELWNLFNFINPGLLGSIDRFNKRFAIPIEKYQNKDIRKMLKKLIQPFILRRTKSQVLEELPPRTEIILEVEMSQEEEAFYEALRQRAVEHLAEINAPSGQKHVHILAEIMKLRRACCNPQLVVNDVNIQSAKLKTFAETIEELLDNTHKALVFSQFVDHLKILREYLESKSISYQYLDGSTPLKQRKQAVEDFQNGQGDVFLISIKAGGFGLNLTAADYVIHMDPWWNPAVEDQASDRAHRIGQQRPVTIYKLITKNTIEEKIVKLHQSKKDLATGLLDGSDLSGKMSAEELMALITER
ncbi:MAG: DEAD/DEAH box helicase [Candidatus Magnetoovum sp. WYHC-5]|nr:DEAD/DEAH box helicase [Candidatus Magnetoovum sp. WYHC-5]